MKNWSFFFLSSFACLGVDYIWNSTISSSSFAYISYSLCTLIICMYIGICFQQYKCRKCHVHWEKINIKKIFIKKSASLPNLALEEKTILFFPLIAQILVVVMLWNVMRVLLPVFNFERMFITGIDSIIGYMEDIQYSRGNRVQFFYFSDFIGVLGLRNSFIIWQSYLLSFCYNKFNEVKNSNSENAYE